MKRYLAACAVTCLGCGAGAPLLHPAHVLAPGDVRAAAGLSAEALVGDPSRALKDAQAIDTAMAPTADKQYVRGATSLVSLSPGIAPYVSARVGLGNAFEGGLTYTGRGARIDARHAFAISKSTAFSIGAGLDGTFAGGSLATKLRDVDAGSLRGFGFDVPALIGWRSVGGIYQAWAGIRGGYMRHFIASVTSEPKNTGPIPLEADQAHVGGLVGVATGFRHIHVALELEVGFQYISGHLANTSAEVMGASLTPATAVWWDF